MNRGRFEYISTSTLRAMRNALDRPPWRWMLRTFRYDVEAELLARDLPAIAEDSGGFPSIKVSGWQ